MKFWWWTGGDQGNFGDILTPVILDYFGADYEYSKHDFEAISTGSIAKMARPGTVVLGSGIMSIKDGCCPQAQWKFVRGPITRQQVLQDGGHCPEIYGDPGMLLPLIYNDSKKIYDVGIVPHYSQYAEVKQRFHKHRVINLRTNDVAKTVQELTECRALISSSLHGIIAAHAYGIPVARVEFSRPIKGDGSKFLDHYAAVGADPIISSVKNPVFTHGSLDLKPVIEIFQNLCDQIQ